MSYSEYTWGKLEVIICTLWNRKMEIHSNILACKIPWTEEPGTVHGVVNSQTQLSTYITHMHSCSVTQSCLTLWNPMDCNPPGSSVHRIFQARILEWIAISSSKGSPQPRQQTQVSYIFCLGKWILYHWVRTTDQVNISASWDNYQEMLQDSHAFDPASPSNGASYFMIHLLSVSSPFFSESTSG